MPIWFKQNTRIVTVCLHGSYSFYHQNFNPTKIHLETKYQHSLDPLCCTKLTQITPVHRAFTHKLPQITFTCQNRAAWRSILICSAVIFVWLMSGCVSQIGNMVSVWWSMSYIVCCVQPDADSRTVHMLQHHLEEMLHRLRLCCLKTDPINERPLLIFCLSFLRRANVSEWIIDKRSIKIRFIALKNYGTVPGKFSSHGN